MDSLSPKGTSTTSFGNSYAHFTALGRNKWKLLKPPDEKPSLLTGSESLIPKDFADAFCPTSPTLSCVFSSHNNSYWVWGGWGLGNLWRFFSLPFGQLPCLGHWPRSQFSSFPDNEASCAQGSSVLLTLWRGLRY